MDTIEQTQRSLKQAKDQCEKMRAAEETRDNEITQMRALLEREREDKGQLVSVCGRGRGERERGHGEEGIIR